MNDRDKLDVVFGVCLQMSLTGDLSVDKEYTYVHICTYISARLFSLEGNERYRLRRGRRIIKLAFFVEISARCKSYQSRASEPWFISNIWLRNSFPASFDSCVAFDLCAYENDKADFSSFFFLLIWIRVYRNFLNILVNILCVLHGTFWNETRLSRSY